MKYRTKLFVAAISVSAISSVFALSIVEFLTRKYLFKFLQVNVASIAGTTAAILNGDEVEQFINSLNPQTAEYKDLVTKLRKARNVNRGEDSYLKFMYITYPDPKNSRQFLIAVDAEEDPKEYSPPGTPDPGSGANQLYDHLALNFATSKPTTDPWGTWISGYAPIFNSKGNYIASVGTDTSAKFVEKKLDHLLFFAAIAFFLSLIESVIIVMFHANKVTRALRLLESATAQVQEGNYKFRLKLDSNDEFQDLGDMMNRMNERLEENEKIKRGFTHYISQNVLDRFVKDRKAWKLEGHKRKVTVLFCHVCEFSSLSRNLKPNETLILLNQYFKAMLEVVFKYNGMLDKLVGDSIIAEFGIPIDDPEQENHAVQAALDMEKALGVVDRQWFDKTKCQLKVQIGIHTGETIIGTIDSENKIQYTSIGDTEDIASQIAAWMKTRPYPIVISETTQNSLGPKFVTADIGALQISEGAPQLKLYNIVAVDTR